MNDNLPRYLRAHAEISGDITDDLSNLSLRRYLEIRIDGDREAIEHVYKGFASLRESEERLPMFCWIADSKKESQKAIFSIRAEDAAGHYSGAGVMTSDPSIIAALRTMFDYYSNLPATKEITKRHHF